MMIVDRIESGKAVVLQQDGKVLNIDLENLPEGIQEGSVLKLTENGFQLDITTEKARRKTAAIRTKLLFKKK